MTAWLHELRSFLLIVLLGPQHSALCAVPWRQLKPDWPAAQMTLASAQSDCYMLHVGGGGRTQDARLPISQAGGDMR